MEIHRDVKAWEERHGSQLVHAFKTQEIAEAAGMIEA